MSLRAFESWALDTAAPAGWVAFQNAPSVSLTGGRFSDGCLQVQGGAERGWRRTFDAQRTWYAGFPIWTDTIADGSFAGFMLGGAQGTFQVGFGLNASGFLEAFLGTPYHNPYAPTSLGVGTHPISPSTWYFVEVAAYIDSAAGWLQVMVNGVLDIDLSSINTQALGSNTADTVLLGGLPPGGGGLHLLIGTAYACDDQGTSENTFLGDCRVIAQVPTGDGAHADWTALTGPDQYAMVDEIPPDGDTSYVSSQTIGALDTFTFPALGITGTVIAVKACMDAEKDDVGARVIAPVIRQLGTDYIYTDVGLSAASYGKFEQIFTTRPSDGNPWEVSDLTTAEFGVAVTG